MIKGRWHCYSRGIAAGGALIKSTEVAAAVLATTTAGGGGFNTTENGGGTTTSTASGGSTTSGPSSSSTTSNGGGTIGTETGTQILVAGLSQDYTEKDGVHNHGLDDGEVLMRYDGTPVTFLESGDHIHRLFNHGHEINIPDHAHGMDHTHNNPPHTHQVTIPNHAHSFDLPPHAHQVTVPEHSHQMNIPAHAHEIEFGIFEGPTPTEITIRVDGNVMPGTAINGTNIDIIPYLSKDPDGKIIRGWHTVEIIPNSLGRVVANIHTQLFVQSRGGGNY